MHRVLSDQDWARDPIWVAFFDQVALFSDFNDLFELLGPGFAPYSSSAFYILELSSKNILKTLAANSMNNFHVVKRMLLIQSLLAECKFCLCHAAGLRWRTDLFLVIVQIAIAKECAGGGRWKQGKSGSLSPFRHPSRAFFTPLLSSWHKQSSAEEKHVFNF